MKPASPKVAARQGGGTRQGFGHFNEEHLEREASAAAVHQKQLAQQATENAQHKPAAADHPPAEHAAAPPREVSTVTDELGNRTLSDIWKGLKSFFDLHAIVGIRHGDTPAEQQRKEQAHKNYEGLTKDQQAIAQKIYKEKMETAQAEENKKQQEKQAKAAQPDSIAPPSSPQKGPDLFGGSRKKRAVAQLQHNRQTLSNVASAG
jgi:hypothetical protein